MLTNIASALEKEPSIAQNIPKLTVMGGHFHDITYQGTVLPEGIDYNLCSDPAAAVAVFSHPQIKNIVLVPADVTLQTFLTKSHLDRLRTSKHPFVQTLVKDIEQWTPKQRCDSKMYCNPFLESFSSGVGLLILMRTMLPFYTIL